MITIGPRQLSVGPRQLSGVMRRLGDQQRKAIVQAFHMTAALAEGWAKERTSTLPPTKGIKGPPFDTGELKRRWQHEKRKDSARLYNSAPHAAPIEGGIRPGRVPLPYAMGGWNASHRSGGSDHWMPFGALVRWAYRKFYAAGMKGVRTSSKHGQTRKAAAWQGALLIAMGVQRKLHYRGMTGRHLISSPKAVKHLAEMTQRTVAAFLGRGGKV